MARPVAIPLTISLLLHGLIIVLLMFNFKFAAEPKIPPPQPNIVMAELVRLDAVPSAKPIKAPKAEEAPPQEIVEPKPDPKPEPPKPVEPAKPEPKPKPEPPKPEPVKPQPKPEPPKPDPAKEKQELEKQKQAEKEKQVEKQKLLEKEQAKLEAAKEAARKAEQQKQEAEKQKQEAEKKRKEQEEAQRKKQQDEAARKQREQAEKVALAKAMAAEEQAMAAANAQEAVTSYMALIQRAIQNNWSRPPTTRNDMRVILSIQMLRTGEFVDVAVVKSSGNDAFDRSAVAAVKRTAQIPELAKLAQESSAVFDKNFRRFQLDFHPEDLRQ